jgi:SagB-type dehydrogenase family enzyme
MLDLNATYILSRFVCLRREEHLLVLETPFSSQRLVLSQPSLMRVVWELVEGLQPAALLVRLKEAAHAPLLHFLAQCEEGGFLTRRTPDGATEEEAQPWIHWAFHDLLFHARSRLGRHIGPFGSSYPWKASLPSPPMHKEVDLSALRPLPVPDGEGHVDAEGAFAAVLERRRTRYDFGPTPLTEVQLGTFLFRTCRVQRVLGANTAEPTQQRPYPSGGGRHPLEVYAVVGNCTGLAPGVYHYHASCHGLVPTAAFSEEVVALLDGARQGTGHLTAPPPLLLVITARYLRTAWKYQSLAYRLILLEVGALLQTMYLVATAMHLRPCALGAGNPDVFARVIGVDYYEEASVGEFVLGTGVPS